MLQDLAQVLAHQDLHFTYGFRSIALLADDKVLNTTYVTSSRTFEALVSSLPYRACLSGTVIHPAAMKPLKSEMSELPLS